MTAHVRGTGPLRPTFAAELARAHQFADVAVMVGLVFRGHRGALGMSQRTYAQWRGWSKGRQGRLERTAGDQRLDEILCALRGTGYRLALLHDGSEVSPASSKPLTEVTILADVENLSGRKGFGDLQEIADLPETADQVDIAACVAAPSDWGSDEFVARDQAGRKFPAHKPVRRTSGPPLWWMFRYSTSRGLWPEWTTAD